MAWLHDVGLSAASASRSCEYSIASIFTPCSVTVHSLLHCTKNAHRVAVSETITVLFFFRFHPAPLSLRLITSPGQPLLL